MFRVITGACSGGTQQFLESHKIEERPYSIEEIINLTKGQYGHNIFVEFFTQ